MPGPVTHMYTAARIAQEYAGTSNETLQRVSEGCSQWLRANETFSSSANTALQSHKPEDFLSATRNYRQALTTDDIAIFSAFTAGSQGPDLWVLPHGLWDTITDITGALHFDMGHYNLTHRFPFTTLKRIQTTASKLDPLQRHYQTAYILGYLTHIALDVIGHIMVNVTAGAYNAIPKEWENDQGNLTKDIFNLHNKTEHYLDAFVRHVLLEGYHKDLQHFNTIRTNDFEQTAAWNFPNARDHFSARCAADFPNISRSEAVEITGAFAFLDLSTSMPAPFAHRYNKGVTATQRVTPFIHHDYVNAYNICVDRLRNHRQSITKLDSEYVKLRFFEFTNRSTGTSYDYVLRYVMPDYAKHRDRIKKIFNIEGFGRFFKGARQLAHRFIDSAVEYLDTKDESKLKIIRHWNLDIGLRYTIVDQSASNPQIPVRIDVTHALKDVAEMSSWKPPVLDWKTWGQGKAMVDWDDRPTKQPHYTDSGYDTLTGASGGALNGIVFPLSGVELSIATFKLYPDSDELAAYIYGQQHVYQPGLYTDPQVLTEDHKPPNHHPGYSLPYCYEDFLENDKDTTKEPIESIGSISLQTYRAQFSSPIPASVATGTGDTATSNVLMQDSARPLPRHIKLSTARKYVCHGNNAGHEAWYDNEEGNFHPDKLEIYKEPFLSEEIAFALYAVVKRENRYFDLFSHSEYDLSFIEKCKHIHSVGVNVILLIFDEVTGATPDDIRLKLQSAFIDGEGEEIVIEDAHDKPKIRLFEIEDALFRFDSAVFLPERAIEESDNKDVSEHPEIIEEQERITGLEMLKCIMIHAQEHALEKMLITGHTDTSGSDSYNFNLSDLRTNSLLHLLQGSEADKDSWAKICQGKYAKGDQSQLLAWAAENYGWDCDPEGKTLSKAVLAFQKGYNLKFSRSIDEDGAWGKQTWGAFFELYQDKLAKLLETDVGSMSKYRSALQWLDNSSKAVGCGELWPVEHKGENNLKCKANRRVEVLFYEPGTEPALPLSCLPGRQKCNEVNCPIYGGSQPDREHLPTHSDPRPQASPSIYAPSQPDSASKLPLNHFYVYIAYYRDGQVTPRDVRRLMAKEGKLIDPIHKKQVAIDGGCDAWFYCSHRDDLLTLDKNSAFNKNGSGLPLIGPVTIVAGKDNRIDLDIWKQKDWVVVLHESLDTTFADEVHMAQWNENYSIGYRSADGKSFWIYGNNTDKDKQEQWKSGTPIPLVKCENGTKWIWAGSLSYLPSSMVKILFLHKKGDEQVYAGSLNEIKPQGSNIIRPGHHMYNRQLLSSLLSLAADDQNTAQVDALPTPLVRCLLSGDMCWQDQGSTNNCGPFSFSAAMNYWYPFTNNSLRKNGFYYANRSNVDDVLWTGARTPDDIVNAASAHNMQARDNDGEEISRERAIKLLKLWIQAGVPVLVLFKEFYTIGSYHWKVITGFDENRFFINNSGADNEVTIADRESGVNYETAPVGNDIDSENQVYKKWKAAGGDIVDFGTSVDECTFIPVYPKETRFAGDVIC